MITHIHTHYDGILESVGFPLTPTQLHKSDFVFRFYVASGRLATNQDSFCLHVEQFLVLDALMGFLDLLDLLGLLVCVLPLFRAL
jgi:hypothetical protein